MENNTNTSVYDKLFILSKIYCYYCESCNYSRHTIHMKHTFNYNDMHGVNGVNTDIWNRMIELTMNRNNNNYEHNEINIGIHIYYTQAEHLLCEFNLPIDEQKTYLLNEFIKKYV